MAIGPRCYVALCQDVLHGRHGQRRHTPEYTQCHGLLVVLLQDRGKDGHLLLGWSIIGLFLLLEPLREPLNDRVSFALYLRSSLLLGERKCPLIGGIRLLARGL